MGVGRKRTKTVTLAPVQTLMASAPTPERLAKMGTEIERYIVKIQANRDAEAEVWRIVPVAEQMLRRGQITELELRAGQIFYRDFMESVRVSKLTSKYGERAGVGGTPISQMINTSEMSEEDRRIYYHQRVGEAMMAIGDYEATLWVLKIICEIPDANGKPRKLSDAGKEFMGYKSPQQATAAGATLIKTGLRALVRHYDLNDEKPRKIMGVTFTG